MTEEEIYAGCRRGDNAARRALYDSYSRQMLAVGMRYVADRATAEDILHDVFVNVLCNFDKFTFRGNGSLKAWMNRVMANASLDYLRKNASFDAVDSDAMENAMADDSDTDAEAIPPEAIMGVSRELPTGYRTVVNLYTFEGKSHREIASLLGINEKSSSSQLSRAKALLTKRIKEYLNNHTI